MDWIVWVSLARQVVAAGLGLLALMLMLRAFDRANGISFGRDVWRKLDDSPSALALYFGLRFVGAALLMGSILGCGATIAHAGQYPDRYDREIRRAVDTYMPGVDWRVWKAQLYQESLLRPGAVSPVGARGLAQFMPPTWAEVSRTLGYEGVSPHDAEPSILAGAYYMSRLRRSWSSPRPERDRHSLAMASYNAGLGSILKSQRRCGGAVLYEPIIACLHHVTGRHAAETRGYAPRIWRHYAAML